MSSGITFPDEDAGSLAADRIRTPGHVPLVLPVLDCAVRWRYVLGKWRAIAVSVPVTA